jgi:putative copper resistance protein D
MELLIDRFGYLRARWIPSEDEPGWQDLQQIESELRRLAQEPAILPPPDEHVH